VTGLPSDNFTTFLLGGLGKQPVTFTKTATDGVYTGDLEIGTLPVGSYTVKVYAQDPRRAAGQDDFDIVE